MEVLSVFIDAMPLKAGEKQKGDLRFQFNATQDSSDLLCLLLVQSSDTHH